MKWDYPLLTGVPCEWCERLNAYTAKVGDEFMVPFYQHC